MSPVNLFTYYQQKENHFTNGLVSILRLSRLQDVRFVHNFFKNNLSLDVQQDIDTFKVLKETAGTPDAELSNDDICCLLETKIVSGTIRKVQIQSHLESLNTHGQNIRKLVLLTPDDSGSQYVQGFTQINPNILHLEWKKVSKFFDVYSKGEDNLLSEIIRQYSEKIRDEILEKDYVGVILTIAFNKVTGVNSETYRNDIKKWDDWPTPNEYKKLDGTGRKLLLYDPERKAITVEVEISKVEKTNEEKGFPWSNKFAPGTLKVYEKPIGVDKIKKIGGLDKFKKGQNPQRTLTHEQYRQLMKLSDTVT